MITVSAPSTRNLEYEAVFLKEVADAAARRFGVRCDAFPGAVAARLEMGERLYPGNYLTADLSKEIREEGQDSAAWTTLAVEKELASPLDGGEARLWHLFEIAQHSAAIDYHARMLRHCD